MLKAIGIILMIGASGALGLAAYAKLEQRIKSLGKFISALEILSFEINFKLTPLPEIVNTISRDAGSDNRSFFKDLSKDLKDRDGISFAGKWTKRIKDCFNDYGLTTEDSEILCDLGTVLGRYSAEEQLNSIAYAKRRLESNLKTAQNDKNSKGKVYKTVGFGLGVIIVLVII